MNKSNDNVADEIHKRLDDLFGEDDQASGYPEIPSGTDTGPLMYLKACILSIDWEIDDEKMERLIAEAEQLKNNYKEDRVLQLFLQLLESLARYIKSRKANSHPDSIKLLNSVFVNLEETFLSENETEGERKQKLFIEIDKFKKLKEQIAIQKKKTAPLKGKKEPEEAGARVDEHEKIIEAKHPELLREEESGPPPLPYTGERPMPYREELITAVEQIKQVIRDEFRALTKELKSMMQGE